MGRHVCDIPEQCDHAGDRGQVCAAAGQQRKGEGDRGSDGAIWRILLGLDRAIEEERCDGHGEALDEGDWSCHAAPSLCAARLGVPVGDTAILASRILPQRSGCATSRSERRFLARSAAAALTFVIANLAHVHGGSLSSREM